MARLIHHDPKVDSDNSPTIGGVYHMIALHESDSGMITTVDSPGEVFVGLEEEPQLGLKWTVSQPLDPLLEQLDESKKGLPDGKQLREFRFKLEQGKAMLVLDYRNPWKPETPIVKTVVFPLVGV